MYRFIRSTVIVLGLLATATASNAQIEEVLVTARRTTENQQDVPIAVTAVTGEQMLATGRTNFSEVADVAPNVNIDSVSPINGSSNSPNINIRGIGTTDFLLTIDPSVGVYVDGVYVARSVGGLFDLLDLEQIEVLRGPQGTLFGRNTIGGAVQLVSRKPNDEFRASAQLTTGEADRLDLRASVSGPLAEDLYGGISVSRKRRDGYGIFRDFFADNPDLVGLADAIAGITVFDERTGALLSGNTTGLEPGALIANGDIIAFPDADEQPGNENNYSARANLVWEPTDRLSFSFVGDFYSADETAPALVLLDTFADDLSLPTPGVANPVTGNEFAPNLVALHQIFGFEALTIPYDDETFVIDDPYSTYATGPGANESDVWGLSLTMDYALTDVWSFKSITAYRELDALFGQDPDHSPFVLDAHTNDYTHQQFSQELQLTADAGRWRAVLGAYLFNEDGEDRVVVPLLHGLAALDQTNIIDNSAWALFAQATYDITEQTSVTGGLRYTDEQKNYDQTHLDCGVANALAIPEGFVVNSCNSLSTGVADLDFGNTTYTLNLAHRFSDAYMAYASYSTGFKSGGFTGRTTAFVPDQTPIPFNEETASTVELGLKTDFERARLNLALFSTEFDDLQVVVQTGVAPITTNAASARIRGIELDGLIAPIDALNVYLSAGFLDAEYDEPPPFPVGTELANAPEFSGNLGFDWTFPIGGGAGRLVLRSDLTYRSKVYNNAENTPELVQNATAFLNASLTWHHRNEHLQVSFGARNLTDETAIITGFFQPGVGYTEAVFNRPGEWFASLQWDW
ncbi:MAG: TonB-dependent receptor [Pseudomonadota bacterium]